MADHFIGADQLAKGASAGARVSFQSAADHCPHDFVQYPSAKAELKRLDAAAARP